MTKELQTAIEYLDANPHPSGFVYLDNATGTRWVSDEHDLEQLGEDLINLRWAIELGEIGPDDGIGEGHIYSEWCADTHAEEAKPCQGCCEFTAVLSFCPDCEPVTH